MGRDVVGGFYRTKNSRRTWRIKAAIVGLAKPRAHSGHGSRQDWPEYCLFLLAWFPPRLVTPALVWSHNALRAAGQGLLLYSTLIPPAAPMAAAPPYKGIPRHSRGIPLHSNESIS